jgi:hypothetical protein
MVAKAAQVAALSASSVRALARLRNCLTLEKASSMGLKSGE